MTWKEVEGTKFWKPEEVNDSIEGVLGKKNTTDMGDSWEIDTKDGKIITPSHRYLMAILNNCKEGEKIRITYVEEKVSDKPGRNPTKIYKVEKEQ